MLTAFWFATDVELGYGVTAETQAAAEALLAECGYPKAHQRIVEVRQIGHHDEIEQDHVAPNAGPIAVRGVWYPQHNPSPNRMGMLRQPTAPMADLTPEDTPQTGVAFVTALVFGVLYGLFVRIGFEAEVLKPYLQIVSTAFLVIAPFSVGAIAVLTAARGRHIGLGPQVSVSLLSMLMFLGAMFACLLEGLICLVLVAPVFLIASMVGGLIAGAINNRFRASSNTLPAFALLPLLLGPIEASQPPASHEQTVSSTIHVKAPPARVFDQLTAVEDIRPEELGFSFVHLIGLPRPLAAEMNGTGAGSVRTSHWEKNVRFEEIITVWSRPSALHYRFNIPPGSIPRQALDRHVEMGGEYFTVLDGGYDLVATADGGTDLTLTTRFVNRSQLKTYGNLWGRMVLADFHDSILGLMRSRADK